MPGFLNSTEYRQGLRKLQELPQNPPLKRKNHIPFTQYNKNNTKKNKQMMGGRRGRKNRRTKNKRRSS
jgi:hypothetical protein